MGRPWAQIALFSGMLAAACTGKGTGSSTEGSAKSAPPIRFVVTRVRVEDGTPKDRRPAPLGVDRLEKGLSEALAKVGFVVDQKQRPGAEDGRLTVHARVTYGVAGADGIAAKVAPGESIVQWQVELKLRPPKEPAGLYAFIEIAAKATFEGSKEKELEEHLLAEADRASADIAKAAKANADVLREDVRALIAGLDAQEVDLRRARVGRLAMLRSGDAVPALIERLDREPDREVVLRVVGALAEIGDDRAGDALMSHADPKDRELLRAVVYALSAIGGSRVADFLDVLATHDSSDIREMVSDARQRLAKPGAADAVAP